MTRWVLASGEDENGTPTWAATNGGDLYVTFACPSNAAKAEFYAHQYVAIMNAIPQPNCAACEHPAHDGVCPLPDCPGHVAGVACRGIIEYWDCGEEGRPH